MPPIPLLIDKRQSRLLKIWAHTEMLDIMRQKRHALSHGDRSYSDADELAIAGLIDQLDPLDSILDEAASDSIEEPLAYNPQNEMALDHLRQAIEKKRAENG